MKQKNVFYLVVIIFVVWNFISYMTMVSRTSEPAGHRDEMKNRLDELEAALQVQLEFNKNLLHQLQQEKQAIQSLKKEEIVNNIPVKSVDDQGGPVKDVLNKEPAKVGEPNVSEEASVIPILVIACNRPDAIKRSLDQLLNLPHDVVKHPIIVSQDCGHEPTADAVRAYGDKVKLIRQPDLSEIKLDTKTKKFVGYYKIARHYKWALTQVFDVMSYGAVIVVEDDLDIAPDFYEYFDATYPILHADPTLWCVSAWNDNGKQDKVGNEPELLYRTDFFPGLGWMMEKQLWNEFREKWPVTFWDDWMRQPVQRKERACVRPEISRTKTFGAKGVSKGQFFNKYLKFIKLNDKKVEFTKKDLSYLMKNNYDIKFVESVYKCRVVNINEARSAPKSPGDCVRVQYSDKGSFKAFAKNLGIMEDLKSGVPRAGYRGVVPVMVGEMRVYLAPPPNWSGYDVSWN